MTKSASGADVARATGISRQALYLHFPDRSALLLAVVEHVDDREDLEAGIAAVEAAADGPAQARAWVDMQARRNPSIASLARALDQSRHADDPTSAAWRDRAANRMRGATAIVQRLRREGRVHRSWTTAEAATLVWELVSFRVWDDLVNEAGLTPERYAEIVTTAVLATLAAPLRRRPAARADPPRTDPRDHRQRGDEGQEPDAGGSAGPACEVGEEIARPQLRCEPRDGLIGKKSVALLFSTHGRLALDGTLASAAVPALAVVAEPELRLAAHAKMIAP